LNMMILKVFFTPDEIRAFFTSNGFEVRESEVGRWDKQTHGRDRYMTWMEDHVVIGSHQVKASDLFERLAEYRLKHMLTPSNNETRKAIETQFNHILKNN